MANTVEKGLVSKSALTAIGDAIRDKNGSTTKYKPSEMADAIKNIAGSGDTSKRFTVVQKPNQTLSVTPGSYAAFSISTDSSGNEVYKTEYPSEIIVTLASNSGYNAGKTTRNGIEKDAGTANPIQYTSDLVDGMVISATDATAITLKSFTDVILNLTKGQFVSDTSFVFNVDSQSPSSPKIWGVAFGVQVDAYLIGFYVYDKYSDCTIKLDTGEGLSENTQISQSDNFMTGEISNQMYTHLKEACANGAPVTLTITVVS